MPKAVGGVTVAVADTEIKPTPSNRDAMFTARKAWSAADIRSRDAARRGDAVGQAGYEAEKVVQEAAYNAARDAALAGANATLGDYADVGYDPTTGKLRCSTEPRLAGPAVTVRKRLPLTAQQSDALTASLLAWSAASYDAFDLARQIEEYKKAHPGLFAGIIGEPPPVDPVYEALKAAHIAKLDVRVTEEAKQGAIYVAVMQAAGERDEDYSYKRLSTDGEIVLGDHAGF